MIRVPESGHAGAGRCKILISDPCAEEKKEEKRIKISKHILPGKSINYLMQEYICTTLVFFMKKNCKYPNNYLINYFEINN